MTVDKATEEAKVQSKIILQVHDELVFDVNQDEHELPKALVKKVMELADNWLEAHQAPTTAGGRSLLLILVGIHY